MQAFHLLVRFGFLAVALWAALQTAALGHRITVELNAAFTRAPAQALDIPHLPSRR
jgi:hypothetical protein